MSAATALRTYLDFEKPILELENKIVELKALYKDGKGPQIADEITQLEQKAKTLLIDTYNKLTPWQTTLIARHPERPHCLEFVASLIEDFTPLAGDRYFAEDEAIVAGVGRFRGRPVMIMGHEKGWRYREPPQAQFRHGQAGGLSQGGAADGSGGSLRFAGGDAG